MALLDVAGNYCGVVTNPSVLWVSPEAATSHELTDLPALLARDDGFAWVDVAEPDDDTASMLSDTFGVHPRAVTAMLERNHVARLHTYADTLLVVLHKPLRGEAGHVHYLELDLLVSPRCLLTVHGPRNPAVPLTAMLAETAAVTERLLAGRLRPAGPAALHGVIVSAITRAEEEMLNTLAKEVGQLEQRVMRGTEQDNPQRFLTELFQLRHSLLTIHTMSAQSSEIYTRAEHLMSAWPKDQHRLLADLRDQYQRLSRISNAQLQFLQGVTEYYRARTDTKMTIAAERLAVIAAVTLPVTAISSVVGMNVIVNDATRWDALILLLVLMATLSAVLLVWAKRQGWW